MRKITFLAALLILLISSCQKGNSPIDGGSWTFKSQTYNAPFCSYVLGALTASTVSSTPSGTLGFYFWDGLSNNTLEHNLSITLNRDSAISSFPPKLQSYKVTNVFPPDSGYVYVQLTDTSTVYSYEVSAYANSSVTVTKDSSGKHVTVYLPPTEMVNKKQFQAASRTDSSLVTGTIKQTQ